MRFGQWLAVVFCAISLIGCGGGDDDGGGGGGAAVNPSDPNAVMNNVLIKVGGATATQQAGNLPTPSADADAPVISSSQQNVTTSKAAGSEASAAIDVQVEGAVCNILAKVAGSNSVHNADLCPGGKAARPVSAKARTNQTIVFTVELEADFEATSAPFCFDIEIQDAEGLTSDPVRVCVTLVTSVAQNAGPVANAGPDQITSSGLTVQLDGSDSFDPDGAISSYLWTQTGGPPVTLNGANSANPTFTAPSVSELTRLTFSLTVRDANNATSTDEVIVDDSPVPIQTGELRFTLNWDSTADLDTYVKEPSGDVISFVTPFVCGGTTSTDGGCLDVDDTSGFGPENVIYASIPPNGTYCVAVDQFDTADPASNYTLSINFGGSAAGQFTGSFAAGQDAYRWYVVTINGSQLTSRAGTANDAAICPTPTSGTQLP
jgi:hypothetical protein